MSTEQRLRVIFMGTAPLACPTLTALACGAQEVEVVAVVTQPDRPKGRGLLLQPSAVKQTALDLKLPVLQPERARAPEFIEIIRGLQPDLIVVVAFGQILPPALLAVPRHGCLNVHTSILPRHRGAAPIQWALLLGDRETGVTIMQMDAGLDTGPVVAMETTPITPEDDAGTLQDRLSVLGAALLVKVIPGYASGLIVPQPQPVEGATYARKITKEDGRLDWSLPADALWNRVRALVPWPVAFTTLLSPAGPALLKIWRATPQPDSGPPGTVLAAGAAGLSIACGQGSLLVTELQREGSRRMTAAEFLAGHRVPPGTRLG
jgi:methionyl-tRNA formyltransferase